MEAAGKHKGHTYVLSSRYDCHSKLSFPQSPLSLTTQGSLFTHSDARSIMSPESDVRTTRLSVLYGAGSETGRDNFTEF